MSAVPASGSYRVMGTPSRIGSAARSGVRPGDERRNGDMLGAVNAPATLPPGGLGVAVDRCRRHDDRPEVAAYLLTGSVGLLSDALESVVNLVAAVLALVALTDRRPSRRRLASLRPRQGRVLLRRCRGPDDPRGRGAHHRVGRAATASPRSRSRTSGSAWRSPSSRPSSTASSGGWCSGRAGGTGRRLWSRTASTCSPTCGRRWASWSAWAWSRSPGGCLWTPSWRSASR